MADIVLIFALHVRFPLSRVFIAFLSFCLRYGLGLFVCVCRILKTGSTEKLSDEEIEDYLEKTVSLFSYLSDKDFFQDVYRNQLAKRLLNQRSASDEMEKLMIAKLKLKCGAQFTAKMEGMLNDLSIGADHAKSFEEYLKVASSANAVNAHTQALVQAMGKIDFSVQVLTTGYWPTYKTCDVNLPTTMQKCTQVFKVCCCVCCVLNGI
jgi:cullin 1